MTTSDDQQTHSALVTAIYRIQKSLAKLSIRLGLSTGEMNELVRRAYLEAAEELITEDGEKILTTKLCAMTGFYRKEVIRLRNLPPIGDPAHDERYNRSARVLTGWLRDETFQTANGKPRVLALQGENSFAELVKKYSGDMAPVAMQQELQRLGVVTITSQNRLRLETEGYLASTNLDALQILGTDTSALIDTIHANMTSEPSKRRFQRKVSYVDIPQRFVEPFRQYAATESQRLLEKLDRWLAKRDVRKPDEPSGSQLGLGIYHLESRNKDSLDDGEGNQ